MTTAPAAAEDLSGLSDAERRRGVVVAIACVAAFGASAGLSFPLFSVLMDRIGWSEAFVGLNTAMMAASSLLVGPIVPKLLARHGMRSVLAIAIVVTAASLGGVYFAGTSKALWFLCRFGIGAGGVVVFIASELWINMNAEPEKRGAALGAYATALAAGFASGPIALEVTGYDGWPPFLAATAMILVALGPLAIVRAPRVSADHGGAGAIAPLVAQAPAIFSAPAVFAAAEASIMSLAPLYVIALGYGEDAAGRLIIVYGAGTVAIQWLLGRGADAFGAVRMLFFCAGVGVLGAALTPAAAASLYGFYVLLFIWGGVIVGVYTVGLALMGDRFAGPTLTTANTGFVLGYNVGALIGPALAGVAMAAGGPQALPATLAGLFALYLTLLFARRRSETP
ncbi:MAG: MFS transporter [Pseudomonadota bacterium]